MNETEDFKIKLQHFTKTLVNHISTKNGQWTIKGFIDIFKNIYTISSDTKIVSKILEIHLFPKILEFADKNGYQLILADHQNYYPDITFINEKDNNLKFALDFKTTYRNPNKPELCNGFTLGSHGDYFINRNNKSNIQFPYNEYKGHFCFGIIYDRVDGSTIDETKTFKLCELKSITSVVKNFQFFIAEKWKIASDKAGSGNTANIGSINNINDILNEKGMFSNLGENWFDDYWKNYDKIINPYKTDKKGNPVKIRDLETFVKYRSGDKTLIVPKQKSNLKREKNA